MQHWFGIIAVACIAMMHPSSAAPVDQVFATAYGASGSNQSTTGSMTASRATLDVASEADFRDGEGITVWGAGPAFSAGRLNNVTARQEGVAGKTTYSYKIAPIDNAGGFGIPIVVSVANGNTTLSTANNITINTTYGTGDAGFVVWKSTNGGAYSYDGASADKDWVDTGWTPNWRPQFIPATPPSTAQADWLVTSIVSGGGSQTLTLAAAAKTSVARAQVMHDDTSALNAAVAANATTGAEIELPCGTYNITSSVRVTVARIGFSGQGFCSIINGFGVDDDFQWIGTSPTSFLHGGYLRNVHQRDFNKLGGNAITVKFFAIFDYNDVFVDHPWRGPEFFDVNDVRASHDRLDKVWGYRGWTFRMASGPAAGEHACCFDLRDVYANNISTDSPGGGRLGSYGFWIDGNVATVISYNSAISNTEGPGLEISNMVGNPHGPEFLQFSDWSTEFSNGPGIDIDAGQEIYFTDPVMHSSRNGNDNVFIGAAAKVVNFQGGRNGNASCNDYAVNGSDVTIANEAINNSSAPNAGGTSGVCSGIALGPTASHISIVGNRIGQEYGVSWRQKYPVTVSAGATNFAITGNTFKGNQYDYVLMGAGYSSTQVEANNSGNLPPRIDSGFGTGSSVIANNGFRGFQLKIGTGEAASSGVIGLPLAVGGWICTANDLTTHSPAVAETVQTASTTTSATLADYNASGTSAPWSAGDVLNVACQPF